MQGDKQVASLYFEVVPNIARYPVGLDCTVGNITTGCLKATTTDGDRVLAGHRSGETYWVFPHSGNSGNSAVLKVPGTVVRVYRVHDAYGGQLILGPGLG